MVAKRVCPWWLGYLLANPIRRLMCDPAKVLAPYVREGMTVLEPGPGMGFFTLELARKVGPSGRVVAVDLQPRMLQGLRRRAARASLVDRVETRVATPDSLGIADLAGAVDFVFAFAMVHEMPAPEVFFTQAAAALRPGGILLLAEPTNHVSADEFEAELRAASQARLEAVGRPTLRSNRAALLKKAV
jgi:SAM-dependent methyltransferase